jgi:hypothetical protein
VISAHLVDDRGCVDAGVAPARARARHGFGRDVKALAAQGGNYDGGPECLMTFGGTFLRGPGIVATWRGTIARELAHRRAAGHEHFVGGDRTNAFDDALCVIGR